MSGSYDFEEQERIAELKAWWEDNRWYVLGSIVAAIVAFAGYRGWVHWSASQAEDAAAMFAPVAEAAKGKDAKKVGEAAQPLMARHPRSYYASEAALVVARTAFDAGNLDEARKQLEWVMANGVEEHRGVARMRLAAVAMGAKKNEEALGLPAGNKDEALAALAPAPAAAHMAARGALRDARAPPQRAHPG